MIRCRTIAVAAAAAAAAGTLLGCGGERDFSAATTAELVEVVAAEQRAMADFETVRDQEDSAAHRAGEELGARPAEALIPELLPLLADPRPGVRRVAAAELGRAGSSEDAPEDLRHRASEALDARLDDAADEVRISALCALVRVSWDDADPAPPLPPRWRETLAALLRSPEPDVRLLAALQAGQLGAGAATALVDGLVETAASSAANSRFMAASSLGVAGPRDPRVFECLLGLLDDPAPLVRQTAASSLGMLGGAAAPAFPRLLALLDDASEDVRWAASQALVDIELDAERAARAIEALLPREPAQDWLREMWMVGLGELAGRAPGSDAARAVRDLVTPALADGEPGAATTAACALAWIASAERDEALARQCHEVLRDDFPHSWIQGEHRFVGDESMRVVEALVELARWPEIGVDTAPVRAALEEHAARSDDSWSRAWTREQLARLP